MKTPVGLLLFLYLCLGCMESFLQMAPDPPKFRHFDVNDGLAQSNVSDILQDKLGFIWIGTGGGLCRFDGYSFKVFQYEASDTNSISDNYIHCLLETTDGKIWVGTAAGGVCCFDPETGKFRRYGSRLNDTLVLRSRDVRALAENSDGYIYVGTFGGGLSILDPASGRSKILGSVAGDSASFPLASIWSITFHSDGTCFLSGTGRETGTYIFNATTGETDLISTTVANRMVEDAVGYLWMGSFWYHTIVYDPQTDSTFAVQLPAEIGNDVVRTIQLSTSPDGKIWFMQGDYRIGVYYVNGVRRFEWLKTEINPVPRTVFCDRAGLFWMGTGDLATGGHGLYLSDHNREQFSHYSAADGKISLLSGNDVRAICIDESGKLFVGSNMGGVDVFDLKLSHKMAHYDVSNNAIRSFGMDGSGNLWIGCRGGGITPFDLKESKVADEFHRNSRFDATTKSHEIMTVHYGRKSGLLWISTLGRGIVSYDPRIDKTKCYLPERPDKPNALYDGEIKPIIEAHDGFVFCGSVGGGLYMLNPENDQFTQFTYDPQNNSSISHNVISAIIEDSKKRLWVATAGGGLNQFDRESNNFTRYTELEGLPDNTIGAMIEDKRGMIWIGTGDGLCRFDPESETFLVFEVDDGFPLYDFSANGVCIDSSGRIYMGGNGLVSFHPDSLTSNETAPEIYVTGLSVLNKPWQMEKDIMYCPELTLSYEEYFFSVELTALNFLSPDKNKYAYKLDGFNTDWVDLGTKREITFTNLPAGNYDLLVKASNNDGIWSEEKNILKITITPPWWKTMTFYLILSIAFIMTIVLYIRYRERKLKFEKDRLERQVELRTNQLKKEKERVELAHLEITQQKNVIEEKNKDITDSIRYASRIQHALITEEESFARYFLDTFVLYLPKDIVSGDFYWSTWRNGSLFFATCDCTGHGVPGAFMSLLNISCLNAVVVEQNLTNPAEILHEVRKRIIESLMSEGKQESKDGMDCALLVFDPLTKILQFACANNPLILVRRSEVQEFKPDKMPVGMHNGKLDRFTLNTVQLIPGDVIYTFTDGYSDQFGGDRGKKFKYNRLIDLISSVCNLPMKEQRQKFETEFQAWKGDMEQLDDVCIVAFQI